MVQLDFVRIDIVVSAIGCAPKLLKWSPSRYKGISFLCAMHLSVSSSQK